MYILTLKPGKHTSKLISKFNQYLEYNNLRVIGQRAGSDGSSIEVEINADYSSQVERANSLAFRFFGNTVINRRMVFDNQQELKQAA